ncbi:MAG: S1 family peptidase [Pseudomonadota bacterium]|nr:S1 family peptidase [Pseudomonadota bacterium]
MASPVGAFVPAGTVQPPVATGKAIPAQALPQTPAEAFAQDGAAYARRYGVTQHQASVRLRALHASAAFTDQIRQAHRNRLVGISIDHSPTLRIVVLLTGAEPVPETSIAFDGIALPVVFRTGAAAIGNDVIRAMLQRGPALEALLPASRGMGLDERSGELVILIRAIDAARLDVAALERKAEALTGVPVRFDLADRPRNLSLAGGGRIEGVDPADGKRYACTSGFAVTDGTRTGIATAAHCPDDLVYKNPDGGTIPLTFAGQWGARTQDVQINIGPSPQPPIFYADRRHGALRTLAAARSRLSTRAGEWLCHYGESSGYSCAEVELTNFAPPGRLCAGACAPTWVTVRTNDCRSGDSGGPVFSGDVAFGITKGGSGGRGTRCNFYFYMSTDFLPAGWRLLR